MLRSLLLTAALAAAAIASAQPCSFTLRLQAGPGGWGGTVLELCTLAFPAPQDCAPFTMVSEGSMEHGFQAAPGVLVSLRCTVSGGALPAGAFSIHAVNNGIIYQWPGGMVNVGVLTAFTVSIGCNIPPATVNDCIGAATVTSAQTLTVAPGSIGGQQDLNASNQGCLGAETSGVWAVLSSTIAGSLVMSASVVGGSADALLDFAVWGPASANDCANLGAPIRCSAAQATGSVGLAGWASDDWEGADGDGWLRPIEVGNCEDYIVYVSVASSASVQIVISSSNVNYDCWPWPMGGGERPDRATPLLSSALVDRTLHLQQPTGRDGAAIIAMYGAVARHIGSGMSTVDVSALPPGAYVLRSGGSSARFLIAR